MADVRTGFTWTALCLVVLLVAGALPRRHEVSSPLGTRQDWSAREVAGILAFGFAANLLVILLFSLPLPPFVRGSLWPVVVRILAPELAFFLPALWVALRREHGSLGSLGLRPERALPLMMGAIATYFLLVVWWAIPRTFGRLDWTDLYRNPLFGDFLAHIPLISGLALVALAALGAAMEEFVFRGFALIPFARVTTPVGGVILTAFLWGAGHAQSIGRLLTVFVMGLVLGWVFLRTGSLVPSLTFHVLWNLGSLSDVVFGRLAHAGVHWTRQEHFLYIGLGSLIVAAIAGLLSVLTRRRDAGRC